MNKQDPWAGLDAIPVEQNIAVEEDPWAGLDAIAAPSSDDAINIQEQQEGDAWLPLLSKALASGVLNFADIGELLKLPYQAKFGDAKIPPKVQKLIDENNRRNNEHPEQKPLFDQLRERLRPQPDTPAKRIAANAAEFASGALVPFGTVAKGVMPALKTLGAGAGAGAGSGAMQEMGVNPLVADILAAGIVPSVKTVGKGALWAVGLNPKNIDLSAAKAASNLGVDLPANVLSKSPRTTFLGHAAEKSPFFGGAIKNEQQRVQNVLDDYLSGIVDRSGAKNTQANQSLRQQLYDDARDALPVDAMVYPQETSARTKDIQNRLKESLALSDNENKVMKAITGIRNKIAPYDVEGIQTPVRSLLGTKVSLNDTIDWKAPKGVKDLIKSAQGGIKEDLARYGEEINPEWYSKLQKADEMHASMAKRMELEKLLDNANNYATGRKSSHKISKTLNKEKAEIKKLAKAKDVNTIDDLAELERALYNKELANPNKSGTATTLQMLDALKTAGASVAGALGMGSAAYGSSGLVGAGLAGLVGTQFAPATYSLVNNRHVKNSAISRALNPQAYNLDLLKYYPVIAGRAANRMNND